MKRWVLIAFVLSALLLGVGAGMLGSAFLWNVAYTSGRVNARTELVLETRFFKDSVRDGRQFRIGDYIFVPLQDGCTVRVARVKGGK